MKHLLVTRSQLAEHWNCSVRKVDRLRQLGLLNWIDLTGGIGKRPIVRFKTDHIVEFENKNLMYVHKLKDETNE